MQELTSPSPLPSFPSFSLHLPLTTNRNGVSPVSFNCHRNNLVPRHQVFSNFRVPKRRGVWAPLYKHIPKQRGVCMATPPYSLKPNCHSKLSNNLVPRRQTYIPSGVGSGHPHLQHHSELQPRVYNLATTTELEPEGATLVEALPKEANAIGHQRKSTETEARSPVCACTAGIFFPPKCELTNQIRAFKANGARVTSRLLWVYKARPAVPKSFGLGTARVRLR